MKNITNKTKTILFASLIAAMILPFSVMGLAEAVQDTNNGETFIKNELSSKDIPLKQERKNLVKSHNLTESLSEKTNLEKEINVLDTQIQKWYDDRFDQTKYDIAAEKQQQLSKHIVDSSNELGISESQNSLPITMISYDYVENSMEVTINPKYFTTENVENYERQIRDVVGNGVDITLSPMEVLSLQSCTHRTSSVCDPIKGGVEFEANGDNCTVGFKATFDGDTGFMTAGHCVDGMIGSSATINQPDHDSTDIGNVEGEYYYHGTDCDCGFVSELVSGRSMDDGVYGNYDPSGTANPFVNMSVKLSGAYSEIESGSVDHINTNAWVDEDGDGDGDSFIYELILADYGQEFGDSGGPIMSGNSLVGLHTAGDGEDIAVFTKHNQFTEHFSGMSWGF